MRAFELLLVISISSSPDHLFVLAAVFHFALDPVTPLLLLECTR